MLSEHLPAPTEDSLREAHSADCGIQVLYAWVLCRCLPDLEVSVKLPCLCERKEGADEAGHNPKDVEDNR